jgi:choline dehydrogenase-like flavoprotein
MEDVLQFAADVLNVDGRSAIKQSGQTLDTLPLLLRQRAISSSVTRFPADSLRAALPGHMKRSTLQVITQKVFAARRREAEVPPVSVYEKAATIYRKTLKQFVDAWIEAEGNVERWEKENPKLRASLDKTVINVRLTVDGFEFVVKPSKGEAPVQDARRDAIALFARIVALRDNHAARMGRCVHCGRYYVNKRGRKDSRFCPAPRDCGRRYTATRAMLKKAQEERNQKIRLLKKALSSWSRKKGGRRDYLASKTGLSRTFITRALNHDLKHSSKKKRKTGGS